MRWPSHKDAILLGILLGIPHQFGLDWKMLVLLGIHHQSGLACPRMPSGKENAIDRLQGLLRILLRMTVMAKTTDG